MRCDKVLMYRLSGGTGDVTERRTVDSEGLHEPERLHDALGRVLAGLVEARDLPEACAQLSVFGLHQLGGDAAGVWRHRRRSGQELLTGTDPALSTIAAARASAPSAAPSSAPPGPGEIILIRALGSDPQAPEWQTLAADLGFSSALAIGLPALTSGKTVLEVYARSAHAFASRNLTSAAAVLGLAAWVLREVEHRFHLEESLRTRDIIGQAQGVLMERYALTHDQAMGYLRRLSQQTNLPVRDLATEVVGRREAESRLRESGEHD